MRAQVFINCSHTSRQNPTHDFLNGDSMEVICRCETWQISHWCILFLEGHIFNNIQVSLVSCVDVLPYPAWNQSMPTGWTNGISLVNVMPWHSWQTLIHNHHIADMSKCWDAQGSEKLQCAWLLTFQILFSPANGRLTSRVSAVAGNWHAWLTSSSLTESLIYHLSVRDGLSFNRGLASCQMPSGASISGTREVECTLSRHVGLKRSLKERRMQTSFITFCFYFAKVDTDCQHNCWCFFNERNCNISVVLGHLASLSCKKTKHHFKVL